MLPGWETSRTQSCLKHLRPGSERPLRLRTRQPSAITPITYVPIGDNPSTARPRRVPLNGTSGIPDDVESAARSEDTCSLADVQLEPSIGAARTWRRRPSPAVEQGLLRTQASTRKLEGLQTRDGGGRGDDE